MGMKSSLNMHLELAGRELGRTVISINPTANREIEEKNDEFLYFGIKNTNQIPWELFDRLRRSPEFLWFTIDKAADKGRSIDTDLINPLTYRAMTGSTSGGTINILKGINDFAIGTDGGGSVLGPAMSCQLPAVIGAGLDLFVNSESLSTDGITLRGSIGIIGKRLSIVRKVLEKIAGVNLSGSEEPGARFIIAAPRKGTVRTPDNMDMTDKLLPYIQALGIPSCQLKFVDFTGIDSRQCAIAKITESFERYKADIILTAEGPVDLFGYGETIPAMFGPSGKMLTQNSGKFLLKAANMCRTTAITIPTGDIASGLLIIANRGTRNAVKALAMAEALESQIKLPDVWNRYYLTHERYNKGFGV
jgi:hypothetical protein